MDPLWAMPLLFAIISILVFLLERILGKIVWERDLASISILGVSFTLACILISLSVIMILTPTEDITIRIDKILYAPSDIKVISDEGNVYSFEDNLNVENICVGSTIQAEIVNRIGRENPVILAYSFKEVF